MRLLILTQRVDLDDTGLGFFHRWLEEFAKKFESITVICLGKGRHNLPANVSVLSLGKEDDRSKFEYILRFYKYISQERVNYDAVFVHMNQEYILLGFVLWKLWNKRMYLWRNHAKGSLLTKFAVWVSDKVFCTSPQSFTAQFAKTVRMPVGVDTTFFRPDPKIKRKKDSILFLGRISPVKNVEYLIYALKILKDKKKKYPVTIAGDIPERDKTYADEIRRKVFVGKLTNVEFIGPVTQNDAVALYQSHQLYINLTPSGSMDKTIIEALSSGAKIIVANTYFKGKLPDTWVLEDYKDASQLAENIRIVLADSHDHNSETQGRIAALIDENSLEYLMEKLEKEIV